MSTADLSTAAQHSHAAGLDPGAPRDALTAGGRRLYLRLVLVIVAVGIVCRVAQYLANPSLWHDEALVTLNVMDRSYAQLLRPLDYEQAAPPLFLWAEKALLNTFGFSEYALRLVSLVAGVGSLSLFVLLSWRLLSPALSPWVVAWFALCEKFIWHSAEVK